MMFKRDHKREISEMARLGSRPSLIVVCHTTKQDVSQRCPGLSSAEKDGMNVVNTGTYLISMV